MTISLLILTHNRTNQLLQCLNSLKSEQDNLLEILILDNGSQVKLQASMLSEFSKIKIFHSEKNLGVAAGRNWLAQRATGELIWFLDDDACLKTHQACEKIEGYFKNPKLALVSFTVLNAYSGEEEERCIPHIRKIPIQLDMPTAYFVGCSFVMRRQLFLEMGGFWEDFEYSCEELDLSYRLINQNQEIIRSQSLQVFHSYFPNSARHRSWIYFNARNRPWAAIRNLPLKYIPSYIFGWWIYAGAIGFKQGEFKLFFRAVIASITGCFSAAKTRSVISPATCKKLGSLGGRLWY
ncbi:MAG: glycosyltransferase [Proteobacteria bacterium]|nr:glycosyltransferase [Pseudomonadota bacterium]